MGMLSKPLCRATVLECLKKHPNGITVTELMRKEPDLSFDMYTPQTVVQTLRGLISWGEAKREEKVLNPKTKFVLIGTTADGKQLRGRTRIERYCRFNKEETVTVKWTPIEVGEKQILYSAV